MNIYVDFFEFLYRVQYNVWHLLLVSPFIKPPNPLRKTSF
ncbi:conserved hypothetical protein [delta proteobacterium NaphS2]|nr:conserved hypothetical protein [delta proteobacterium NaphS2]